MGGCIGGGKQVCGGDALGHDLIEVPSDAPRQRQWGDGGRSRLAGQFREREASFGVGSRRPEGLGGEFRHGRHWRRFREFGVGGSLGWFGSRCSTLLMCALRGSLQTSAVPQRGASAVGTASGRWFASAATGHHLSDDAYRELGHESGCGVGAWAGSLGMYVVTKRYLCRSQVAGRRSQVADSQIRRFAEAVIHPEEPRDRERWMQNISNAARLCAVWCGVVRDKVGVCREMTIMRRRPWRTTWQPALSLVALPCERWPACPPIHNPPVKIGFLWGRSTGSAGSASHSGSSSTPLTTRTAR